MSALDGVLSDLFGDPSLDPRLTKLAEALQRMVAGPSGLPTGTAGLVVASVWPDLAGLPQPCTAVTDHGAEQLIEADRQLFDHTSPASTNLKGFDASLWSRFA